MLSVVRLDRSLVTLILVAFLTGALAGCVGDEDVGPAYDGVPGCEDAEMATIAEGGAIGPKNWTVALPVTICLTNEDTEARTFQGMEQRLPDPDWVPEPAVVDPHAEHRGGAYTPIEAFTVEPGATYILEGLTYHGVVMMMEAGKFENFAIWEFLPVGNQTYPSFENQVIRSGSASGTTDAGSTDTHDLVVDLPDMTSIHIGLFWDDSANDGTGGSNTNEADRFEVRLVDPDGEVVVKRDAEAREGEIRFQHSVEIAPFPEFVMARGLSNATQKLYEERPGDTNATGTWKVEIELLSAPGLLPDEDGSTKELPGGDGQQDWTLDLRVVHKWPALAVPDAKPNGKVVQANL